VSLESPEAGSNVDLDSTFETMVINQEADIVLIIGGLQCIICTCLNIQSDGIKYEEEQFAEDVDEEA